MFARSIKVALMALVVHIMLAPCARAYRQVDCPGPHGGSSDSTMGYTLYHMAPVGETDHPCSNEECRAKNDLSCAADALSHLRMANSMVYLSYRDLMQAQRQYRHNVWAIGTEHPARIPLYCTLLARIAPTATGPEWKDNPDSDNLTSNLIYLAIRLDRPRNTCLSNVLAALPQTPIVQHEEAVHYARACLDRMRACQRDAAQNTP